MPDLSKGELNEERWAVVSSAGTEKSGLTYQQAEDLLGSTRGKHGLCITTAEAAEKQLRAKPEENKEL